MTEVEEKLGKFAVIPTLRLKGAGGRPLLARNVLVFRVDDFQGDAVAQAIVIRDCQPAA